jgi:hypothetical protein
MAGFGTPVRATAVATPNNTEGVVATVAPSGGDVANPSLASTAGIPGQPNYCIEGVLNITTGATTTAVVVRCRRGGVAGTQVGTSQSHTLAAAASGNIAFKFTDPGAPVETQYVITVQQTGGSAAGTVNEIVVQVSTFV